MEQTVNKRTIDLKRSLHELETTKDQLVESEKQASLGRLVRGVSHEMNTPIGILLSSVSLLKDLATSTQRNFSTGNLTEQSLKGFIDKVGDNSALMEKNVSRMAKLTEQFKLSSAEESQGKKKHFNIAEQLSSVVSSKASILKKHDIQTFVDCSPDLTLRSYPSVLQSSVTQLIENSIQHGFLTQDCSKQTESATIKIKVRPWKNLGVKLIFSDNGQGMDSETQAEIFEPFFTLSTNEQNIGLGMHSVFNWVNHSLRGQISCRSELGKGTIFILKLKNHPEH